jgi:aminopeptidase N
VLLPAARIRAGLAWLAAAGLGLSLLSGCGSNGASAGPPAPAVTGAAAQPTTRAYDAALSSPREDSVYPAVGDPGVDALHYGLDLSWDPTRTRLTATESLLFRAATTADHLQLDLAHQLQVSHVWLDGQAVPFRHDAKDLVVDASMTAGDRHLLQLTYAGTPEPVRAPTDRPDFDTTGWTTTTDGSVWTMQEPYGAYSWYAVNDQPSDKAFYDISITAPSSMAGVANGRMVSRVTGHGRTVTRWRLADPASSYLVTVAIGHLTETHATGPHGLPITYWTPSSQPSALRRVRYTPQAIAYLEHKLGRYPFPTLGVLVVPSQSAMETQSTITLGNTRYTLARDTLVHELAHQWYGDTVTPGDWSDLWMSESMALYLAEGNWTADHGPDTLDGILSVWNAQAPYLRRTYGPPADYHPLSFGEGNVYYIPALMWDLVRQRVGDREFWQLARQWLAAHRFTSQDRDTVEAWWSRRTGQDLRPLFQAWLLGRRQPAWHPGPGQ